MADRRDPETVMRLSRLGSFHQCRLSFMRQLTRRMAAEHWQFSRGVFDINASGVGHAVYTAHTGERSYSLVAFAHDLPDELRSDRVIAEAWDATFALFDGIPTRSDIQRLSQNVPLQEAGRVSERELSLSRANRSVRLWAHVVETLAQGRQPDPTQIDAVGYLMRTTAVYGSGKFGAADREKIASRPEMQAPFQAEMLSVFLTRWFVRDLVDHMALMQGGTHAVRLASTHASRLGIGNSTGLGMAPFIINHPVLFNNWIMAREQAIARVRNVPRATPADVARFQDVLKRANRSIDQWHSKHPVQIAKLAGLKRDQIALGQFLKTHDLTGPYPWDALVTWTHDTLDEEAQELVASLILEPYPDLVDGLGCGMADNRLDTFLINGSMTIGQLQKLLMASFGWAKALDWQDRLHCARAWYVSEEKLEPRLGERFDEPISDYEQPLAPARDAALAMAALTGWDAQTPVADFLARHPQHRHTIRRAQISQTAPYGEIRDNTISAHVLPIDMLRAKLSFFGATHFDPRSDRWVRICMFAGAPYPQELTGQNADFWVYPEAAV